MSEMLQEFKIRIFQPSVPEYRKGLYEGLGERYANRIELWASPAARAGVKSVPIEHMPYDYSHVQIRFGNFYWQKGLSLRGLSKGDVLVVGGEIKGLSNIVYAAKARLKGIKVIWWGHHWSITSNWVSVIIRLFFVKLIADAYLCYTKTGVDFLRRHGFKNRLVFATGNTIDQLPVKVACEKWTMDRISKFKEAHGLVGKTVILICAVLRDKVKLGQLMEALSDDRMRKGDYVLVVIGDGPARGQYELDAESYGVADRIIWVGATRDQEVMAPWFLSASVFVYPGAIGLGIIHSMMYGLPVIVNDNPVANGPEYEIMEDGKTGFTFHENDVGHLVEMIIKICSDDSMRREMGAYARGKALKNYSIESMVDNFSQAIEETHLS